MYLLNKQSKLGSSRRQIQIQGVEDGVLILPNNHYRMVLKMSPINFELKSELEQDALTEIYQSFLNSLTTPLQIVIRIREMDMDKYLQAFQVRYENEKLKVYKDQALNYSEFVGGLVAKNKILSRQFYIIIPYLGLEKDFEVIKEQLNLSAELVIKGLRKVGVSSRLLSSIEILEMFYEFYSPHEAKYQPLSIQTELIIKRDSL
jgi:type IV secretory pathway VirB4 component